MSEFYNGEIYHEDGVMHLSNVLIDSFNGPALYSDSGTPASTVTNLPTGSIYVNNFTGDIYVNKGTAETPSWKTVTVA